MSACCCWTTAQLLQFRDSSSPHAAPGSGQQLLPTSSKRLRVNPSSSFVFRMFAGAACFFAVFHGLLILFIVVGGFVAIAWPPLAWVHAPTAAWGILVSAFGLTCPLSPLENWFRVRGNMPVYESGFIDHYIVPALCPSGISPPIQVAIVIGLIGSNTVCYSVLFWLSGSA